MNQTSIFEKERQPTCGFNEVTICLNLSAVGSNEGTRICVDLEENSIKLKEKIFHLFGIAVESQTLLFNDTKLEDYERLKFYGITENSHLLLKANDLCINLEKCKYDRPDLMYYDSPIEVNLLGNEYCR